MDSPVPTSPYRTLSGTLRWYLRLPLRRSGDKPRNKRSKADVVPDNPALPSLAPVGTSPQGVQIEH